MGDDARVRLHDNTQRTIVGGIGFVLLAGVIAWVSQISVMGTGSNKRSGFGSGRLLNPPSSGAYWRRGEPRAIAVLVGGGINDQQPACCATGHLGLSGQEEVDRGGSGHGFALAVRRSRRRACRRREVAQAGAMGPPSNRRSQRALPSRPLIFVTQRRTRQSL